MIPTLNPKECPPPSRGRGETVHNWYAPQRARRCRQFDGTDGDDLALVGFSPVKDADNLRRLVLFVSLLIEQNEEWAVGRRYMSLESMALLKQATPSPSFMQELLEPVAA